MSTLTYTIPTIGQLNSTEDVDIVNAFTAIQTWANGNIDYTNLTGATDLRYATVIAAGCQANSANMAGAGIYLLNEGNQAPLLSTLATTYSTKIFHYDPADYTQGARATKLRLRVALITNGTAGVQTSTIGLYNVSAVSGGVVTLGTVISGSTVLFTSPAVNTMNSNNSGDFTAPATGFYVIGLSTTGAWTAGSSAGVVVMIQEHAV